MRKILIAIFTTILISSCNSKLEFAFDNVEYVCDFPLNYEIKEFSRLTTGSVSILGLKAFDDHLLISCANGHGCIVPYSKTGERIADPFLRTGRGPGEVLFRPYISWCSFYKKEGASMLGIYDNKGNYIEYDIDKALLSEATFHTYIDSLSISGGARYFLAGTDLLICRKANDRGGYDRFLTDATGNTIINESMSFLNSFSSEEANILSTSIITNTKNGIIAELGSRLNIIHIYSIVNDFHKTIALGTKLEDIHKIEQLDEELMSKIYYEAKAYDDFFAGLYLNTTFEALDSGSFAHPQIHLFKWDGTPIACLTLPTRALFFEIDIRNKQLYFVDAETEDILVADISDVL